MSAERIETIEGRALPMRGEDIDTDRIMPARFLKSITFEGLEAHLFEDDRLAATRAGQVHPFDEPKYRGASILLVNRNFGSGSSREHAPQGLRRLGIRAVIGGVCDAGSLTVSFSTPANVRDALMTGAWDTTGLLMDRYEEVNALASRLPYLSGFSSPQPS
jgi:3-isopropylmalate/(R)-2-methylmalate dehydratase small subunit